MLCSQKIAPVEVNSWPLEEWETQVGKLYVPAAVAARYSVNEAQIVAAFLHTLAEARWKGEDRLGRFQGHVTFLTVILCERTG